MTPTVAVLYAVGWAVAGATIHGRLTRRWRRFRAQHRHTRTGTVRIGTVRYRR